jgi:Uma2 family endonuclease
MSTIELTYPMNAPAPSATSAWIPAPLYRLTLEQYEAMVASGIFTSRDRIHLINGYLVAKTTQNPPHVTAENLCGAELNRVLPNGWYVRPAKPIRLPVQSSEPEPDQCIVRGRIRDYADHHPGPADIALIVEVADSSLDQDRKMAQIYGSAGIPVYWIIDLVDGQVEVYSNPGPSGYSSMVVLMPGHVIAVVIDGVEVGPIPVSDILP